LPTRLLVSLVAVLCTASAAPAHGRTLPVVLGDDAAFLHGSDEAVAAAMRRTAALGVDRVRLTATWDLIARSPNSRFRPRQDAADPADYTQDRWRPLDRAVREAAAAGLERMVDIGFWAPRWATAGGEDERRRTAIDPADFRDFAVAVARRYDGTFVAHEGEPPLPSVDLLALWNEPNHPAFLLPQWAKDPAGRWRPASPEIYRAMVLAAYPAVKAAVPGVTVLVGNTSARGTVGGRAPVPPLAFVRSLACVDRALVPIVTGACADFAQVPGDGWAHHPYALGRAPDVPSPPGHGDDVRLADLPKLIALLDRLVAMGRLAPGLRDVYLTEYGYETEDLVGVPGVSEATQARYLTWAEYLVSGLRRVKLFSQFLLRDVPPAATRVSDSPRRPFGQFGTGLLRADGTPKVAATTFPAGVFAARTCHGVELWARLRLGAAPRRVRFERSLDRGGRWRTLRSLVLPGEGTATIRTAAVPHAWYRLSHREAGRLVAGLPVQPKGRCARPAPTR
jgi:hypothetical protein